MGFGKGSAEYREILGKNIGQTAIDRTKSGDDSIAQEFLFFKAE